MALRSGDTALKRGGMASRRGGTTLKRGGTALRALAVVAALGTALVGGAGTAAAQGNAQPRHHVPAHLVELTTADTGSTVEVHQGDVLEVTLTNTASAASRWTWSVPTSSDPEVLVPVTLPWLTGQTPTRTTALFVAGAPGTATLSAQETCRPTPGAVCSALGILWRVTVDVS